MLLSNIWVDDKLINASQKILAKQFVNRFVGSGFQNRAVGLCGNFSIETGEFIQILHDRSNHWLTILQLELSTQKYACMIVYTLP